MKIKSLKLKNFAKFTDFECEFNSNITHLVGVNGSGKTTIGITAIWACLKGISEKNKDGQMLGERFRFIGSEGTSAKIELTLIDEKKNVEIKVKNNITKTGNNISFEAPPGYPISQNWLNELLSVVFLSAKNFSQLNGKEQAIALGINTNEFDTEIKELKEEFTIINREIKNFGEVEEKEKAEKVSVSELIAEIKLLQEYNLEQDKKQEEINVILKENESIIKRANEIKLEIEKLNKEMNELKEKHSSNKTIIDNMPKPEKRKEQEILDVEDKISLAEETNKKAIAYENYLEKFNAKEAKNKELISNKEKQTAKQNEKLEFIKKFDFGIKGLGVNDEGELELNERPIRDPYYSKGELEVIVARLYAKQNPELKVRFIDDFELLDEDNQEKLITNLLKEGFQIITAEVGKVSKDDNTLLLRECKIVDEYEKPKDKGDLI